MSLVRGVSRRGSIDRIKPDYGMGKKVHRN